MDEPTNTRNKGGRPPVPEADRLKPWGGWRVSDTQLARYQEAALLSGYSSVNVWARAMLDGAADLTLRLHAQPPTPTQEQ